MGYHEDAVFPEDISYGSRGGPGFFTDIVTLDSGLENRFARWNNPKHVYNAAYGVKSQDQFYALKKHFMARHGAAYGFPYKDWNDFTSASDGVSTPANTDVEIGEGDGTETEFQLIKLYTDEGQTLTRNIEKPKSGTVVIAIDGTPQSSGWSVNTTTGIVTFTSAPSLGEVITAGFEFYVPCRYGEYADKWLVGSYEGFDNINANVEIIELVGERAVNDVWYAGGCKNHGYVSANMSITMAQGLVHLIDPAPSLVVTLPAEEYTPYGLIFVISNEDASNSITLKNDGGGTEATLGPSTVYEVYLTPTGWVVV